MFEALGRNTVTRGEWMGKRHTERERKSEREREKEQERERDRR